jgi:hypothetical protein
MLAFGAAQSTAAVWRLVPSMKTERGPDGAGASLSASYPVCYDLRSRATTPIDDYGIWRSSFRKLEFANETYNIFRSMIITVREKQRGVALRLTL